MARFIIVNALNDGGLGVHPMKEWLRQNPDFVPAGMHPTSNTSRQLLSGLKRNGWSFDENETEVRLFPPGEDIDSEALSAVLADSESNAASVEDQTFGLEKQLRDFLADNIESLRVNGNRLRLFVDQTGRDGIEYPTSVGFIDILGVDDNGNFYVFELKRDVGSDQVVGQAARYMGWVKSTIGKGKEIYGVIVAKKAGEKLRYAASIIPGISLYEYNVQFHLNEASEIRE
ncbi:endonuclease NucS domain-containing protein [Microbulbifer sp. ZKSA004]|uniref:endonuclease NucS domain-containing protein n=1 Tax=Microbulbifer sp. ZKSA004 TaxID=3243389 RepID=UPI00403A1844